MKRVISTALSLVACAASMFAANPLPDEKAVVQEGNARFTVLTPEMIRIEYSATQKFEDNATFAVINRELPVPKFSVSDKGQFLTITTDKLTLRYRKGTDPMTQPPSPRNLTITMSLNGKPVTWYPGLSDPQNLRGTYRTLDSNNGDAYRNILEEGVISRSGWAVINDSPSATRADGSRSLAFTGKDGVPGVDWVTARADSTALDLYFMGYGHDYKRALKDFTRIAGKIPLPPDYVFGYWYSKYENYTADDFRNIVQAMKDNDINADVLILDMDWHYNAEQEVSGGRGGWTGWCWNKNLIPDPEGLLKDIHDQGLHVALNLHPADGVPVGDDIFPGMAKDMNLKLPVNHNIPWQLEDTVFAAAFSKNFLRPMEKSGVDFWWLDWQQYLTSPYTDGLGETFWCNHYFFNEMKKNRPDRRPLIYHRWGGLGSHRYQIGFSGDTFINFPTLAFLPYFTATASNVGYVYWGHDIGGHMWDRVNDVNDPELLLRWIQMGVFTPIFRTHATKGTYINRMIWTYDDFPKMREAVKLRYALFPYIYTAARQSYDTGIGLVRPMYYEYPEAKEAYDFDGQYFFGDNILVAPVTEASTDGLSKKKIWFPEGNWWSVAHDKMVTGNSVQTLDFTLDQIPYFYRQGAIIVTNPPEVKTVTARPDRLIVDIVAGADGEFNLYEDAGDSNNYDTEYATTRFTHKSTPRKGEYTIHPRQGTAPGLVTDRAYELRIHNTPAPVADKAKVDGKTVPVTYDPATRCTTLHVPTAPCTQPRKITIAYN